MDKFIAFLSLVTLIYCGARIDHTDSTVSDRSYEIPVITESFRKISVSIFNKENNELDIVSGIIRFDHIKNCLSISF